MDRCIISALMVSAVLAGCSEPEAPAEPVRRDPVVVQALNDPLMTDPDLSQRNEGAAALTVTTDMGLPILPPTPEAIAAARADATRMMGGPDKLSAPPAANGEVAALPENWSPGHHLAAAGATGACLKKFERGAIFAARMPAALPVYPRGGTLAAAGSDTAGCATRAVRFVTPVPASDVLAFYWARATAARTSPEHLQSGPSSVIRGKGNGLSFDLRLREASDQTFVELATVSR